MIGDFLLENFIVRPLEFDIQNVSRVESEIDIFLKMDLFKQNDRGDDKNK